MTTKVERSTFAARFLHTAAFLRRHAFLAVPVLFYGWHMSPSLGLGDAALFLTDMQVPTVSAYANNHNIAILTGWVFSHLPLGSMEIRGNLVSVFYGALTVDVFYLFLVRALASRLTAAVTALILMVSHSLFWHSTLVESYTVNTLLVVLAFWLIWRWRDERDDRDLVRLVLLSGLALFQHPQLGVIGIAAAILAVGRAYEILRTTPGTQKIRGLLRLVGRLGRAALIALVPYLLAFLADMVRLESFSGAVSRASGGAFRGMMLTASSTSALREVLVLWLQQFPSPFLLAVPVGFFLWLRRFAVIPRGRGASLAFLSIPAVTVWFFTGFDTWDRFAFLLPFFLAAAVWGAYSVDALRRRVARGPWALRALAGALALGCVVFPPYLYARIPEYAARSDGFWAGRYSNDYTKNTHDLTRLLANPSKRGVREIETYVQELFAALPEGAIYVDDDSRLYYPVHYVQTQYGARPDLKLAVVNSWGFAGWGLDEAAFGRLLEQAYAAKHPLFLVSLDDPFRRLLSHARRPYRFTRFPLGDGTRWIYRLAEGESETEGDAI